MILFSVKISEEQEEQLRTNHPDENFCFNDNMGEAKQFINKAEVIVTYGSDLSTELINEAKQLKWIMVFSAGIDKLPLEKIKERNILVTNAKGIHKVPMSEYAISMLLQVYRLEKTVIKNEAKAVWNKRLNFKEITGRTMLIVGTGAIGQEVARLAKAFQMTTYGVSRSGADVKYIDETFKVDELNAVLPKADFIISVLPGTKETTNLFSYEQFTYMKEDAIFLNMGRGNVVNEADLLQAIKEEQIAHAVLDVVKEEPLHADHPFWYEENITVTPHLSGVSSKYLPRSLEIFTKNLEIYNNQQDSYINKIDVERGY